MARLFDITTTSDGATTAPAGTVRLVFTVTNTSQRPLRGSLRAKALDSGQASWLAISGETERDFPPGLAHQVEVNAKVPAGAAAGKFRIRLDALSVANPDDDFTEGPAVSVTVAAPAPKPPAKSMWWVWLIVGLVVLFVVGVALFLVFKPKPSDIDGPAPTPTPTPTPAPAPAPAGEFGNKELMLVNAKTGKCLTIAGGVSTANNVEAVQFDCDNDPSRRWTLIEIAAGSIYQMRNVRTGKCLTIAGGRSTENNVTALQFDCDSDPSRTWRIGEPSGNGFRQIMNVQTNKCLTIAGGVSTANNVGALQFDCDADLSRRWTIR